MAIFIQDNNLPTCLSTIIWDYNMHISVTGNEFVYLVVQNRLSASSHYSNILLHLHLHQKCLIFMLNL